MKSNLKTAHLKSTNGFLLIYFLYKRKGQCFKESLSNISFWVTLHSDSCMNYFPENKISHFISRIPTAYLIERRCEASLVEFTYQHTWYNVNRTNNFIEFDLNDEKIIERQIPPGFYKSVPDILKAIAMEDHRSKIYFTYNPITKLLSIKMKNKAKVLLFEGLAQMLGFDPCEISMTENQQENHD